MSVAFLGAIALALVVMAAIQVGAIVYAARLARRVEQLVERVERDLAPTIDRLTSMSTEAARAAALAAAQVERVDAAMTELGARLEHTAASFRRRVARPVREVAAIGVGVRAGLRAIRGTRRARLGAGAFEEDDSLFIG